MTLEERLNVSATKIALREPFIMAATGKLPRLVSENKNITAATNGTWVKFGRPWVEENVKDDEELFGLDLHERLHVVLMHMWRRDGRDPAVWNIANDAIINCYILSRGYKLPAGGVIIDWVTNEMNSEDVYNRLRQEGQGGGGNGQGTGEGGEGEGEGEGEPGEGNSSGGGGFNGQGDLEDAPESASVADIEATIRAAAQMSRDCGAGNAIVDRILGATPKASVNWKDEVRAALTSASRDDFTFRKFSRRFLHAGMYLPALYSDAMGGLVIGFDTSGSMSEEDCKQVAGEIQGIVDDLSPDWVEVVYCDYDIGGTQRFQRGDAIELRPVGGGGTRFSPVFEYAEQLEQDKGERVAALIYLTDMCGNLAECKEPTYPVIWGNVYGRDCEAPFGSVVRVIV